MGQQKDFPWWISVIHDFLVCCRAFFLTVAGIGMLGYFYGAEAMEITEVSFAGIRYTEIFLRGIPFSRVLASLFFASLLSLGDSVLPKPSVQMRRTALRWIAEAVLLGVVFSVIAYLLSIAH
jgi:hypothetical protein